jgi:hypothetical protein
MQAIELQANIDETHHIHLQVPDDWPPQQVKVIVLLEAAEPAKVKKRTFGQFRGKVHMADDFNTELPDEFWLGKDA